MQYTPLQTRDQLEAAIKGEAGVRSIIYAYETGAVIEQANKWAAETSVPNAKAYSVDIKSNTAVEDFLDAHPAYPAAVIYQDGKLQKIFEGLDGEKTKQMLSYLQN